jgi:hypothetical protein
MTSEEIIEMARQAGIIHPEMVAKHLVAFANLVAAKERERICKQIAVLHDSLSLASAAAIRARGEQA